MSNVEKSAETNRRVKASNAEESSGDQPATTYLKAVPLRSLSDIDGIKDEVRSGTILIVKVSPLANKSIEDVKTAVNDLCEFVKEVDGDIARLGEERVVLTPPGVRVWREKTIAAEEQVPTAA